MTNANKLAMLAGTLLCCSIAALAQLPPSITEYAIPSVGSHPDEIVAGADGAVWFTDFYNGEIGRSDTGGNVTMYPIPTPGGDPSGITAGPDGALWFTEFTGNKIGRITTAGVITEFPLPGFPGVQGGSGLPTCITAGPDGALWFTVGGGIGRITTAGSLTVYPPPPSNEITNCITAGPDGALWFTAYRGSSWVGRIATDGTYDEEYAIPTAGGNPVGITAGPDGALWFAEYAGNKIIRITTGGAVTEYPIPTSASGPFGITPGPDGAMWFTERTGNKIGRITMGGVITEYPTPTSASGPFGITPGPDGAMWFTEFETGKIGQAVLAPTISEFPLPTASSRPWDITSGPDGALWFVENNTNKIGRIATEGTVNEYSTVTGTSLTGITAGPDGAVWYTGFVPGPLINSFIGWITTDGQGGYSVWPNNPRDITAGPDGALWFLESGSDRIGRITTAGAYTESNPIPTGGSGTASISSGPDSALWFTELNGGKIGRITTAGAITESNPVPTPGSQPYGIATGSDGALWFTELFGNQIGRITTAGTFTEYRIPTADSLPRVIAAGPDGALWFTESNINKIGRITAAGSITEYPIPSLYGASYGITSGPDGALWFTEPGGNNIGRAVIPLVGRHVFSYVATNAGGANNIQYVQFLFSKSGLSALNACFVSYDPIGNLFYLLSDDMTQWYGLLGGSNNTIGNAQCTIHGVTSGSTASGTNLTTSVDISFRSGFAGLKTFYAQSATGGVASGWQIAGAWNDTGDPGAVEITSLTPNLGNGGSQVFTAVIKDGNGAFTVPFVDLVMTGEPIGSFSGNGCFIFYAQASNVFYLLNDSATAFSGLVAGSPGSVSNSQCTLSGVGSGGTAVGSNLTVTYNLTFSASFAGTKQVYMQAADNNSVIEVWHQVGTWNP